MIQLRSSLLYLFIFTIVGSFIAYKIVMHAYDIAYADYNIVEIENPRRQFTKYLIRVTVRT